MRATLVLFLAAVALASVCAAQTLADNGNWSCALPKAYGGAGTCQPFCTPTYITASTKPDCSVALGSCPACTDANYATQVPGVGSQTCTQSTDARCTSAALSAQFSAWPNVQVNRSPFFFSATSDFFFCRVSRSLSPPPWPCSASAAVPLYLRSSLHWQTI